MRRPDAGLDCGSRDPGSTIAAGPRLVVEVLSPNTRDFDAFEKLDEYKSVPGLEYILLVEPNQPAVRLWRKAGDGSWSRQIVEGLDAEIDLPQIGVTLCMSDVYDGSYSVSRVCISTEAGPRTGCGLEL
ncbi:Uma2 family endonuclease [Methylobacterium ajmalii]|uniref:Uma2 family endonuclease n=1 Tax=Methylobacterium ajmalii TaxID=2738439 RepID=UPI0030B8C595